MIPHTKNGSTPAPLTEITNPRQIAGEPQRRWFTSEEMDLVVWLQEGRITGFQLCYGKLAAERALTWQQEKGFIHLGVDDGSTGSIGHKGTPVLVADGDVDAQLLQHFEAAAASLPTAITQPVISVLRQHPDFSDEH